MTEKQLVRKRIIESPCPLAVHELKIEGVSENSAATRISELAAAGELQGRVRKGYRFKEWWQAGRPPVDFVPVPIKYDERGQSFFA